MSKLILYPDRAAQTMEGFGVSGAWWAQVVGGWTQTDPDSGLPYYERIAQLLFDKEKGIGITAYRHNLGGGSQNSKSSVFNETCRMAECHLKNDGTYDWLRDENAVRMLLSCVKNGCEEVVLFCNTPPERLTKNGKSCLNRAGQTNIKRKNFVPFADYLITVTKHFLSLGVPVQSVSPINEPVWVWTDQNGQEGCHYRPWQAHSLLRVIAEKFKEADLPVLLSGAENGDLRWFNKTYSRMMLGDKKIKAVSDGVDVHSYFLPLPFKLGKITDFANDRIAFVRRYRKWLDRHYPEAKVRVSEWTHMQGGRDYGMDSALVQAETMMDDICLLNACAWQHWIAVSNVDYCDGLLYIDINKPGFEFTKRYYAFGNFSKFIPVGAQYMPTETGDATIKAAAFEKDGVQTVVLANFDTKEKELSLPQFANADVQVFVTDQNSDLVGSCADGNRIHLTPRSVTTLVFQGGTV